MTPEEFALIVLEYNTQTQFMSFQHMLRRTPAYARLIAAGPQIIPYVINGFKEYTDTLNRPRGFMERAKEFFVPRITTTEEFRRAIWGMHWVLILMDLTHFSPIQPESVAGGHMQAWNVDETCEAWIDWYEKVMQ